MKTIKIQDRTTVIASTEPVSTCCLETIAHLDNRAWHQGQFHRCQDCNRDLKTTALGETFAECPVENEDEATGIVPHFASERAVSPEHYQAGIGAVYASFAPHYTLEVAKDAVARAGYDTQHFTPVNGGFLFWQEKEQDGLAQAGTALRAVQLPGSLIGILTKIEPLASEAVSELPVPTPDYAATDLGAW